jgi:hypothetical protein
MGHPLYPLFFILLPYLFAYRFLFAYFLVIIVVPAEGVR